ncbi:MAG: ATP-binding cassette domain-containing protein [Pararhizobium sp.]
MAADFDTDHDPERSSPAVPPALEVRDVSYSFGSKLALDGVSFTLEPGKVTALLGPNGAGKTTLFSLITGLYACRRGDIRVAGHPMRSERTRALSKLGIMFQAQTLDIDLTVQQNLRYFAALRGLSRAEARERITALLDSIDLAGERRSKVRNLSGGQRRRVEVARALLDRPALLLLDEPSTGLDIATRRWLVRHFHALAESEGICVLLATHLVDEVAPGDDLIVLDRGRIVARGRVEDVVRETSAINLDQAFTRLTSRTESRR